MEGVLQARLGILMVVTSLIPHSGCRGEYQLLLCSGALSHMALAASPV